MIWFVPFILMWPLFLVPWQVSMKTSTDGFTSLRNLEIVSLEPRSQTGGLNLAHRGVLFKILSELPAFKNWEIAHVLKTQTSSFFWNIRRSGHVEPAFLLGNSRLRSWVAAVSSGGRRAPKFARASTTLSTSLTPGTGIGGCYRSVLLILALRGMWVFSLRFRWSWGSSWRAILSLKVLAFNFQVHEVGWYSF